VVRSFPLIMVMPWRKSFVVVVASVAGAGAVVVFMLLLLWCLVLLLLRSRGYKLAAMIAARVKRVKMIARWIVCALR
jgi:hypothetical protein